MANEHRPAVPVALEQLIDGFSELEIVLGDAGRRALPIVQARLTEAMAARDRGDPVASLQAIGAAMEELAALANGLDPFEGAAMRTVAERFRSALLRGDVSEAKGDLDLMFEKSGTHERKKQP